MEEDFPPLRWKETEVTSSFPKQPCELGVWKKPTRWSSSQPSSLSRSYSGSCKRCRLCKYTHVRPWKQGPEKDERKRERSGKGSRERGETMSASDSIPAAEGGGRRGAASPTNHWRNTLEHYKASTRYCFWIAHSTGLDLTDILKAPLRWLFSLEHLNRPDVLHFKTHTG